MSLTRIGSLNEMRTCLADGYPFVFGFTVYSAFESDEVATTGVLTLPAKGEKVEGGHAVMAAGYDDAKKRFIVRNSWDTDWGNERLLHYALRLSRPEKQSRRRLLDHPPVRRRINNLPQTTIFCLILVRRIQSCAVPSKYLHD